MVDADVDQQTEESISVVVQVNEPSALEADEER